jgi:hypothetical protein
VLRWATPRRRQLHLGDIEDLALLTLLPGADLEPEADDSEPMAEPGAARVAGPMVPPPEKRTDPEDGDQYIRDEFLEIYGTGGAEEWDAVGSGGAEPAIEGPWRLDSLGRPELAGGAASPGR